jgi:hypothetical protein
MSSKSPDVSILFAFIVNYDFEIHYTKNHSHPWLLKPWPHGTGSNQAWIYGYKDDEY